ncbi:phage late control D family protein [Nocardia bovistercoris]|uniref:Phage late control D family protein n=1 Tax=Nocardia bovistercoris TaxID=2785916 RepID=A0A931N220_9NOCA|nr:contractile injection system protein, VgrG/Pvc8 family [Nocardia bovistercoris]MBH0775551.1 phage late control D family protein [Nocardia bovistercoris]
MKQEKVRIEFGGTELPALYDDLVSLEVELDDELAGLARISLAVVQRDDGTWPYLDDDRFRLWQTVEITVGLGDAIETLLHGYVTHLRPDFPGTRDQCLLEIWAMDVTVLMDRREVCKDWPNRRDSDIATEIFSSYGLSSNVIRTGVVHDDLVSTIIQGETDIRFLRRLARRNGFECYVSGKLGYFGPPELARSPQPLLRVMCGEQTNVTQFAIEVEAVGPATVGLAQIDPVTKESVEVTIEKSTLKSLGARTAASYLPPGVEGAHVQVGQCVTTGHAEAEALCQALYERGEWFVTGEGEVAANYYGTILLPHRTVTIKGIGATYSGIYHVTRVIHSFVPDGYTQIFTVRRNALQPNGSEKFVDGGTGLPDLPI